MRVYYFPETNPQAQYLTLMSDLMDTKPFNTGEWQAMDVSGSQLHATHELEDVSLVWDKVPTHALDSFPAIDLNWAREHFTERVSGQPLNPAPSHTRWPYAVAANAQHTKDSKFDHTYPERFWPRHAGHFRTHAATLYDLNRDNVALPENIDDICGGHSGIRFPYGDLQDVVGLLATKPLTRQAYLPVWFPEDTGATENQRVPCTLGYHFMQRGGLLSCRYYMRSCEAYRHLSNDVYFAVALMHWICLQIGDMTHQQVRMKPGKLVMHISSLHAFVGDTKRIKDRMEGVSKGDL